MPKILIIDDEKDVRDVVGEFLQTMGYDVIFAENGMEGLKAAKKNLPQLVLIDALMPKMNGTEVCSFLKKDPVTAPIPVLFLTGQAKLGDAELAFAGGAQGYITKPVDFTRLLAKVKSLIKSG